jgi:23S rRNA pseudouridine1911/1915/1917 synthase
MVTDNEAIWSNIMDRHLRYTVEHSENGWSIEHFLRVHSYSKPIIVHLKKTHESIMRNGVWSYTRTIINEGDIIDIHFMETKSSENIIPSEISYESFRDMIVYEDEDILVLNKPAALPVHPSKRHYENTLANYCAYYYETLAPQEGEFVFRCVNRLDRDTSGLVLIAKNMLSSAALSLQQQNRGIHRTYLAIVEGTVPESGTIDLPIARKNEEMIERCVDFENGERAITHYECVETAVICGLPYSLVKLKLETGRTHQIRVHMKAIGHPLIGDFVYNPDFTHIGRQALHSYQLEFVHPITENKLCFVKTPPEDFFFVKWQSLCCN